MISDDKILRDFGTRLKNARVNRKMTQEQLAQAVGTDKSRISQYENGHRGCSLTTAYRLAECLDVPFSFLMDKQDFDFEHGQNEKDRLSIILGCVGRAVVEWGFQAYSDEDFADYSTMHCIGLLEDSFGDALRSFNNLKEGRSCFDRGLDLEIHQIACDCAEKLLKSKTFMDGVAKK